MDATGATVDDRRTENVRRDRPDRGCGAAGSPAAPPRRWPGCPSASSSTGGWPRTTCAASRAHARVLARAGLLDADELGRMLGRPGRPGGGLRDRRRSGPTVDDEDVHTALERGLLERLGALGGKLRAGRSRNDQVATDLRLYLRDHARGVAGRLVELADALVEQAARHVDTAGARA